MLSGTVNAWHRGPCFTVHMIAVLVLAATKRTGGGGLEHQAPSAGTPGGKNGDLRSYTHFPLNFFSKTIVGIF